LFFGYSVLSLSLFFIYSFLLLYCSTANKVEYNRKSCVAYRVTVRTRIVQSLLFGWPDRFSLVSFEPCLWELKVKVPM